MRFFEILILTIVNLSKLISAVGIAGGVALAFVNVVGRYIFEASFTWAGELTIYLFLWSFFFGAVFCFYENSHIAVDILLTKVPKRVAKTLTLISIAISFIFVVAVAYYGYKYVELYIELEEMSIDLDIPLWIPYLAVPISFTFSGLILLYRFLETLKSDNFKIKSEVDDILNEFESKKASREEIK